MKDERGFDTGFFAEYWDRKYRLSEFKSKLCAVQTRVSFFSTGRATQLRYIFLKLRTSLWQGTSLFEIFSYLFNPQQKTDRRNTFAQELGLYDPKL